MRKVVKIAVLVGVTLSLLLSSVGCGGAVAQRPEYSAPNFSVYDADMNERTLEEFIGKPIVLNFWATWCGYCKIEMPDFDEAYKTNPDVQFMMINHTDGIDETVDKAKAYVEREGFSFPVFFDTTLEASEKYGVTAFPTTVFINSDGDIVKTHRGALSLERLNQYLTLITE